MLFDVPTWVAQVSNADPSAVTVRAESNAGRQKRVEYAVAGRGLATVTLRGLAPQFGRGASWELVLVLDGRAERVEVPAGTRFRWLSAAGDEPARPT